jgi:uncharacterized protein
MLLDTPQDPGNASMRSISALLGRVLPCLLVGLAACAHSADTGAQTTAGPRVLVVGGDQHHDFDRWFDQATSATLAEAGAVVSYTDVPGDILAALPQIDVLYLTNNQPLPGAELRDAIFAFVGGGNGLLVGHAAAWYSWSDWPAYNRRLVSGGARSHLDYGAFDVTVTDPAHPVMRGVPPSFTIRDELYRFEKDPAGPPIHVLATGRDAGTGREYPVVWAVGAEQGRIVVHTLGHDGAAHHHPAYRTMLQDAVRWVSPRAPDR